MHPGEFLTATFTSASNGAWQGWWETKQKLAYATYQTEPGLQTANGGAEIQHQHQPPSKQTHISCTTTWSCHCNDMYLRKALKQLIVPHKAGKQADLTPTTACLLARMACMHGWRACLWGPSHGSSLCAWSACVPVGPLKCPLHSRVSCSCACGPLTCPKACAHGLQLRLLSPSHAPHKTFRQRHR
jgi:hypothetical protein